MKILYPGIGNEKLKPILTEKINLAINDFQKLSKVAIPTEENFKKQLKLD